MSWAAWLPVSALHALPIIAIGDDAAPDSLGDHTTADTEWDLDLTATDPDPGPSSFTWSISSPPAFGTASTSDSTGSGTTLDYVPQEGFIGTDNFTVKLSVGSGGADYLAVQLDIGPQLTNISPPVISVAGGLNVAGTLFLASAGFWNLNPAGFGTRYQWFKVNGSSRTAINGATQAGLALTPDLLGAHLLVEVTAWANGYAHVNADSAVVGPVLGMAFDSVGVPTLSGTPQTGETLVADPDLGDWSPVPDGFTYQCTPTAWRSPVRPASRSS